MIQDVINHINEQYEFIPADKKNNVLFWGVPLDSFDKDTLIKLLSITQNLFNEYRDEVITRKV